VYGGVGNVPRAVNGVRLVDLGQLHHGLWSNVRNVALASPANKRKKIFPRLQQQASADFPPPPPPMAMLARSPTALLRKNGFIHNRRLRQLAEGVSLALHWRYGTPVRHPEAVTGMRFGQNFGTIVSGLENVAVATGRAELFKVATIGLVGEVAKGHWVWEGCE
jgi:hypothetical protein